MSLRGAARRAWLGLFSRTVAAPDGRRLLADALAGLLRAPDVADLGAAETPYADLGRADARSRPGEGAVFVTGRFRSGSTLLWSLFRHVEGFTSWYEPFNERRWFDARARGDRVDATHRGVGDYWREYDGHGDLARWFRADWNERRLLMEADAHDPAMERYLSELLARSPGRALLQFNRVDFRLPWLRRRFPGATVIHLYRHPRDQWISTLVDPARFPRDGRLSDFAAHDHYYLRHWARDLAPWFPFLDGRDDPHPYELFYRIWKLSYLFGRRHAHHSVSFEALVESPRERIADLLDAVGVTGADPAALAAHVDAPSAGRWRDWADDEWFRGHEAASERVLAAFLGDGA